MNTIELNDNGKNLDKKSSISLNMSHGCPLQIIADQRFHRIITRAMKRARVIPLLPKDKIRSECSSWSSASIDLRTSEPDFEKQLTEKLQTIDQTSKNQKIVFLLVILIVLLCIGIILSIVLPLVLIKHPSTNDSTDTSSSVDID